MANRRRVTNETLERARQYVGIMEVLGRDEVDGVIPSDLPQRHNDN